MLMRSLENLSVPLGGVEMLQNVMETLMVNLSPVRYNEQEGPEEAVAKSGERMILGA